MNKKEYLQLRTDIKTEFQLRFVYLTVSFTVVFLALVFAALLFSVMKIDKNMALTNFPSANITFIEIVLFIALFICFIGSVSFYLLFGSLNDKMVDHLQIVLDSYNKKLTIEETLNQETLKFLFS